MGAELKGSQGAITLDLPTSGIGRDPANRLVINDSEVSWHHEQIVQQGQGHHILDLGSRNGTFVNGQRLQPNVPRPLRDGDAIRFGNTTTFIYTNESLRYTPTKAATPPSTPPPPSTPVPGISSPAYRVASFQQQSPPATLPIEPKKKAKSETPHWVTIVGGLASIATIFGLIFTIYTATHPSPTPTPTPGPSSNSPVPSIPQLHSSYQGMFTHTDNSGLPTQPFAVSSLVENSSGHFTASGSDFYPTTGVSCSMSFDGNIQSDDSITFTGTEATNPCNGAVLSFTGNLFPDGHLEGQWKGLGAFAQYGGAWGMS